MSENIKFVNNTSKLTIKIVGIVQIIGGLTGLFLMSYLLLHTDTINGSSLFIFLFGIGLFLYSIYCGKKLLFDRRKNFGIIVSIINQLLQLLQFNVLGFGLSYSSGLELLIGVRSHGITFNASIIKSTFLMSIHSNNDFFIQLNLVSLLAILFLIKIYQRKKKPVAN